METLHHLKLSHLFLHRSYDLVMFAICLLYSLTAIPGLAINELLENLIILGSLPVLILKLSRKGGDNQIFWLFLIAMFVQIASWLNSMDAIPDNANSHPQLDHLAGLFLFVFIAFWINNNKTRTAVLYASLIIGFIVTALYDNNSNGSFTSALQGERIDYNMANAQFTSMLSVVVLMLTVYLYTFIPKQTGYTSLRLLCAAVIGFALFSLVASQSRQSWLAVIIVLGCTPLIYYRAMNIKRTVFTYLAIALFLAFVGNMEIVQQRLIKDAGSYAPLVEGNWDALPMNNTGIRVHSWLVASEWIAENPILGTDYSSVTLALRSSEQFQTERLQQYGHFHNYYFETLVAYGFLGLIVIGLFYREIIRNIMTHQTYKEHILLLCFLTFWAIINCFESFNDKTLGLYAQTIVLAGLYSYRKPTLIDE